MKPKLLLISIAIILCTSAGHAAGTGGEYRLNDYRQNDSHASGYRDSDGDGVMDYKDMCMSTVRGAHVDGLGCATRAPVIEKYCYEKRAPRLNPRRPAKTSKTVICKDGVSPAQPAAHATGSAPSHSHVLERVWFHLNRAELLPPARDRLDLLAQRLSFNPDQRVLISGHTCSLGTDRKNMTLSQRRAQVVHDYLVSKGVDPWRMEPRGYGEFLPESDNNTRSGREENRRVVIRTPGTGNEAMRISRPGAHTIKQELHHGK